MSFIGQTQYDHQGQSPRTGVLLTNLGTPDEPTAPALRRYLREFLSDPRVVEVPRLLWWLILNLFILPFRPARSARLYAAIWREDGSPLMRITRSQAHKLQQRLDASPGADVVPVVMGMRYGNPSLAGALQQLSEMNVRNIIVLPLYPQYCGATTGSTFDALSQHLQQVRWVPGLTFINGYHQHPAYIDALCNSIRAHIAAHGMPDRFILSYHGTPQAYLEKGDPYSCFCQQTSRLVREQLGLEESRLTTTFQSRFGREPWLQPYTDVTLQALPAEGVRQVAVLCPGFAADCLETLEEIEVENRDLFIASGGESFHYIPCLNDADEHIDLLHQLVQENLSPAANRN
ncbi:ferrochelatase [Pseudomaricurvus sp. HS19]|uniref:ferrochelatase n=1 Tax=Pseudomaricurvus sp. HS19 TaxID=2692626 RepID=UPI00136B8BBE|nr:ferrochelatase [Pseudomaricurvus sp. HS19]MYM62574.1 ferrochelatase [Pseudomaricurvus sp. HS19]